MSERFNKQINVSELDYDQIKNNLKDFLRSQDILRDYDFEGSALSTIIDVLSYVTHYNAVNAHIGINETFLETSQYRGSAVGHARQLGYTPKSVTGATATISIQVNNPDKNNLILPKGHVFRTVIDGLNYTFITTKAHETQNAFFADVEIKEGTPRTIEYIFDSNSSENFIIPDLNVDTTTLDVRVYDTINSDSYVKHIFVKDLYDITPESPIYFLNESFDGRYEIRFGDGVLGKALTNGNRIEINYLASAGLSANNASRFSSRDSIEGNGNLTIITINPSNGGSAKESIRSIKYNAPLTFVSQNRAVTANDYRAIILENFNNISSIVVWGGENNTPPQYGKVFISIVPAFGTVLTDIERKTILEDIVKPKCALTAVPELVDPEYTYVSLEVFYKRKTTESSLSLGEINEIVRQGIIDYNDNELRKFNGILRYSMLLNEIDRSEKSIVNSNVRVYLKKRFVPELNVNRNYELLFSSPIYNSPTRNSVIKSTTVFVYNLEECILTDYINASGERRIRILRNSDRRVIKEDAGFVDALAGKIVLENFVVSQFNGSYIEITVIPDSNDVAPKLNNVVEIDTNDILVAGENDRTLTDMSLSNTKYDFISRHG